MIVGHMMFYIYEYLIQFDLGAGFKLKKIYSYKLKGRKLFKVNITSTLVSLIVSQALISAQGF